MQLSVRCGEASRWRPTRRQQCRSFVMTDQRGTKSPRGLDDPPLDTARQTQPTAPAASEDAWEDPWADEARGTLPFEVRQQDLDAIRDSVRAEMAQTAISSESPRRSSVVAIVPTAAHARTAATFARAPAAGTPTVLPPARPAAPPATAAPAPASPARAPTAIPPVGRPSSESLRSATAASSSLR